MTPWSECPNEILSKIFDHLKENNYGKQITLGQCALTCRSWQLPAQKLFFETICVSNIADLYKVKRILNNPLDGYPLGSYVKKVRYRYRYNMRYPHVLYRGCGDELLDLIDKNFPFFEVLDYDPFRLPELRYLFNSLPAGKFKYLKQISTLEYISYFRFNYTREFKECVRTLRERNKRKNCKTKSE